MARVVEAYIGEYASGKSENAINRALELGRQGRQVTLVDLDTVEPFYTLRPIKRELENEGISVVAWETSETYGLGEAGSVIKPEMRWVLRRPGDIILDIGYGVHGVRGMKLVEGADEDPDLRVFAVINVGRPLTSTVESIVEYVQPMGRLDGLLNNSHLGQYTDQAFVQEAAEIVTNAANILKIDVIATVVTEELAQGLGSFDCMGNPVRIIKRYMPKAFW